MVDDRLLFKADACAESISSEVVSWGHCLFGLGRGGENDCASPHILNCSGSLCSAMLHDCIPRPVLIWYDMICLTG